MFIKHRKTTAYACPACASIQFKQVNLFRAPLNIQCKVNSCKNDCVQIERAKEGFRIIVLCPVCHTPHQYNMKATALFADKLTILRCPNSGDEIFWIGDAQPVEDAVDSFFSGGEDIDPENLELIKTDILMVLSEMLESKLSACDCGSHELSMELSESGENVIITCAACGNSAAMPISGMTLVQLENSSGFILPPKQ